ncbi:Serine/threonine transporter SstT, partial [Frankliniella fusca]
MEKKQMSHSNSEFDCIVSEISEAKKEIRRYPCPKVFVLSRLASLCHLILFMNIILWVLNLKEFGLFNSIKDNVLKVKAEKGCVLLVALLQAFIFLSLAAPCICDYSFFTVLIFY